MANKISLEIPDDSSLEAGYIVKYDGADWVTSAPVSISEETGSYILATGDAGKTIEMNVASANSVTVPPESSVDFPVGTEVFITQTGAGLTSLVAGAGVTINSLSGLDLSGQWSSGRLIKRGSDIWVFVTEGAALELDPPTYTTPSAGDYLIGGYHDFDGVDEYIDFGRITSMERDTGEPFTISAWWLCAINPGIAIRIEDANNRIVLYEGGGPGYAHVSIKFAGATMDRRGNTVLPSGWNHVMVTCDGVNTAGVQIFVNGVQETSYVTSGSYPTASATWGASTEVMIGGPQPGFYFEGQIAEVAMWSTDQSANVAAIYNSRVRHNLMDLANPPDLFYAPLTSYGDDPGSGGSVAEVVANNNGSGANMETADAVGQSPATFTSTLTKVLDIATSVVTTTKVENVPSGTGGTGSSFP